MVGSRVVLVWISIVPIASLGCLLGRDFLDAVGAILDFAGRSLTFTLLPGVGPQRFEQMAAGHYQLPMMPECWPRMGQAKWRRCGVDDVVVELQMSAKDWLARRLSHETSHTHDVSHEHMLTESNLEVGCCPCPAMHELNSVTCIYAMARRMTSVTQASVDPDLLQSQHGIRAEQHDLGGEADVNGAPLQRSSTTADEGLPV